MITKLLASYDVACLPVAETVQRVERWKSIGGQQDPHEQQQQQQRLRAYKPFIRCSQPTDGSINYTVWTVNKF